MVRCAALWLCLLAGLLASAAPLPLSPVEEGNRRSGEQPRTESDPKNPEGADGLSGPAPAPATPTLPPVAPDWPPRRAKPANRTGRPVTDSSPLQLRATEARRQGSGQGAEGTAVGQHGGAEATPASVEAGPGGEGGGPSSRADGGDGWDVPVLNRTGGEAQGPAVRDNQGQRAGKGPGVGPNQAALLRGRARGAPAVSNKGPGGLGSRVTAEVAHRPPQAERAGSEITMAMDTSGVPQTPSRATQLERVEVEKQGVSDPTHDPTPSSRAPRGQGAAQVTVVARVTDSDTPGTQSQAELGGHPAGRPPQPPDALLSAREGPGAEETEPGAEEAKELAPAKRPGLPGDGFGATTTAMAMASGRGPSLSGAPSSGESEPRQTTALDSVRSSASSLLNAQEGEAAPSPSTPFSRPYLAISPSPGWSTAAGGPAQSRAPEEPAGPTPTEPAQRGHPSAEQGVTGSSWTRGAQQQDAGPVKGRTPGSTGPAAMPPSPVTAGTETWGRDEHHTREGVSLSLGRGDEATPTTEDALLIFEPPDDYALSEVAAAAAPPPSGARGASQLPGTVDARSIPPGPELVATADGVRPSSVAPPAAPPSRPVSPGQTSGSQTPDAVGPTALPLLTAPPPEPPLEYGNLYCEELGMADTPAGTIEAPPISKTTVQAPLRTVAMATGMPLPSHRSGLQELESEEEPDDQEEEDEDAEQSKEAEGKEDATEVTTAGPMRPTFSHVPYHFHPGSIWVQRNQGLVHSWVEKIRDKAGYVSGMLAPVGIGIAGALFILGALYSIKVMHRKRRSGFKRQRRKHREAGSRQDRVMLLADSSEDEF